MYGDNFPTLLYTAYDLPHPEIGATSRMNGTHVILVGPSFLWILVCRRTGRGVNFGV